MADLYVKSLDMINPFVVASGFGNYPGAVLRRSTEDQEGNGQ